MKLATNQTIFCYVYKTLRLLDNTFKIFDIAAQEINFLDMVENEFVLPITQIGHNLLHFSILEIQMFSQEVSKYLLKLLSPDAILSN